MADKKISALTGATTPLDGTEVLPIVQSGTTVKVANNDLRPKQIQSNATSGVLQVTGPASASTRIATVPDANFTVARTDAAQSFTGDQTLSTGNIIQGTAAKGFNFTANTGAAGKASQLLNWYEEGTWTPTVTFATPGDLAVVYSIQAGFYTRIGNKVQLDFRITTTTFTWTTASSTFTIAGLPFTATSATNYRSTGSIAGNINTANAGTGTTYIVPAIATSGTTIFLQANGVIVGATATVIATWFTSGTNLALLGSISYRV